MHYLSASIPQMRQATRQSVLLNCCRQKEHRSARRTLSSLLPVMSSSNQSVRHTQFLLRTLYRARYISQCLPSYTNTRKCTCATKKHYWLMTELFVCSFDSYKHVRCSSTVVTHGQPFSSCRRRSKQCKWTWKYAMNFSHREGLWANIVR